MDEFNKNGRRTELIRGIILEKPIKSPFHCLITKRLYDLISAVLPPCLMVFQYDPLTLSDSEPEPDISVVRGTEADFTAVHPRTAELVIEVAVSSALLDREDAALYAEAGVKEYWIALGNEQTIEVYRRPLGGRYQELTTVGLEDTLQCGSIAEIRIPLRELFQ